MKKGLPLVKIRVPLLFDFFFHPDLLIAALFQEYGLLAYAVFFLVIFCETGLIVMPFLPGDSLLFAVGALLSVVAVPQLEKMPALFILSGGGAMAAILGDAVNYAIGYRIGPVIFSKKGGTFFNRSHLDRAQLFYQRHGGKTIIMARFIPIIRTFAPFVAGMGKMAYSRFFVYNVIGGVAWVGLFIIGGYLFGNIPMVKNNLTLVILVIIVLSILPGVIEFARHRTSKPL